jgi:mRNA interferase RelE/StbE
MAYRLVYTQRATKDISKLPAETKQRIKKALEKYVENPFLYATKMADSSLGMYRFRVGSYRILFDIENNDIVILRIGSRDGIYKK